MEEVATSGERFPKWRRLRKRREFSAAQRRGERVSGRHFVLLVSVREGNAPSADPGVCRLGIVASRKVGGSTVRNRAKRLVREWFRRRYDELPSGVDLVVIARRGAGELDLATVASELDAALPRVHGRAAAQRQRDGLGGDGTPS